MKRSCVLDAGDPPALGRWLTLQTSVGFLLTIVSIRLLPWFAALIGWRWAFLMLVPGPLLGAMAMKRLMEADDRR